MTKPITTIRLVITRDVLCAARSQTEALYPLIFFTLCVLLFPFAIGSDEKLLEQIAPAILWVSALLSATLSLEQLFRSDYQDGSFELFVLSKASTLAISLGKSLTHWLISGLPVVLMSIPLCLVLELDWATTRVFLASLFAGTLTMSFIGAAVSALTVGLRGGGLLLAMLILPLYIPVLIFGSAAAGNATRGLPAEAELYFLTGLLILAVTLAPWATAAAIKIRLS